MVLITGGNGGIGLGMAQLFQQKGDQLIIMDLPQESSTVASRVSQLVLEVWILRIKRKQKELLKNLQQFVDQ